MVKLKKGDILICKKRGYQSIPSIVGTELTIDESAGGNHYRLTTNYGPYEGTKFGLNVCEDFNDLFEFKKYDLKPGDEVMYQEPGYSTIKCTIVEVDKADRDQTYRIEYPEGAFLWAENKHLSRIEKEDNMRFKVGDCVFHHHKIGRSFKIRYVHSADSMSYELVDLSSGISTVANHCDLSIDPGGEEVAEVKYSLTEFISGDSVMIKSSWDTASPSERRHLFTDFKSKIRLLIKESRSDSYLVQYNIHGHTTSVLKSKVERFDSEKRKHPHDKEEASLKEVDSYSEKPPIELRKSSELEFQEPVVVIKKSKKRKLYVVETSYKN